MNATALVPTPEATTDTPRLDSTLRSSIPANDPAPSSRPAVLRPIARAIHERRVCVIRYASEPGGAPSTRAVEPLAVISTRGALGLLAWCRLRRDLRTFRIDRIRSISLAAELFDDHPGLALERFIEHRRRDLP
ncbi:MAG: WYL domain-containing protein [Deltaproteobacteria bacterium]|jgi:predicted DNA-binding transcriptional regulator YafY|nr:WYL domain-containing protein [Deltaproteobacteria bacterium]